MVISSFVFFDLETTGLPWQERNQTKIIELSLVSALRTNIQATAFGDIPPVKKLTFVLNPQRQICPAVTKLTGLSNELLQHAPRFSEKIKSVSSFLESLPRPICLIAHNGNVFDFKILLAEYNDACATLPNDLFCVDSLVGFRKLLKGTNINYTTLSAEIPMNTLSNDDLLTDDEDWPDLNMSTEEWCKIDKICESFSDLSCEDFSETERIETKKMKIKNARSKSIRNVFHKNPKTVKDSYTLTALYKRLMNKEENNAHRAEADCMMLVECAVALKNEFLPWCDGACKLLTEIKPIRN